MFSQVSVRPRGEGVSQSQIHRSQALFEETVPEPLVPGLFSGVPLVLSLILSKVLFQVLPGGRWRGSPARTGVPSPRTGTPPGQDWVTTPQPVLGYHLIASTGAPPPSQDRGTPLDRRASDATLWASCGHAGVLSFYGPNCPGSVPAQQPIFSTFHPFGSLLVFLHSNFVAFSISKPPVAKSERSVRGLDPTLIQQSTTTVFSFRIFFVWFVLLVAGQCCFFLIFVWTKVHFVEPLIAPVLDFVCPSSWVSKPEWISCLHSFLLACCDPEGHNWCNTCLFHQ